MSGRMHLLLPFFLTMFILLVWSGSSWGQRAQPTPPVTGKTSAEVLMYEHPRIGYQLAVPPGVQLEDRGDERGITLSSRKGYLINVQTGSSNPSASTHDLLARLEAQYLGPGRPWSVKIEEAKTSVAGLDSLQAIYEGSGSRIRVIVARGKTLDYVFFFFSSPENFKKHEADFNWLLENFQPVAADKLSGTMGNVLKFNGASLGYMMDYPETWVFEQTGNHSVVFSGKPGTPEYFATVNIQNIGGNDSAALTSQLKRDIARIDGAATFADDTPFHYSKDGRVMQGHQFSVSYNRDGNRYRQWSVAIPRRDGKLIHLWSYAAPDDRFARHAPVAGKMLGTWTIIQ